MTRLSKCRQTQSKPSSQKVDALAGRGIGDFAEDGRTARAGRRRQICRALVNRFISEESEGEGFLSVFGQAEAGGSKDRQEWNLFCSWWKTLGRCGQHFRKSFLRMRRERCGTRWNDGKNRKLLKEQGVMCAAAGDDELVDPVIRQDETIESVGHGSRRERRGGVNEVIGFSLITLAESKKLFDIGGTEIFTPGGLRWFAFKVGILEKDLQQGRVDSATSRKAGVFIETQAAVREMLHKGVDKHVGGPGVEGQNL